jgi:type VI secretion system (T6SS) baseplate-like injector VgrG
MSDRPTMQSLGFTEEFGFNDDPDRGPSGDPPDAVGGMRRYWGKYRGVVRVPIDPEMRGRLMVSVEDVWGPNQSSWALPALPYAGLSLGMFVVPAIGANVWVEFMHGHPDYPIWTGFWWGSTAQTPTSQKTATPGSPLLTIESLLKHAIVISDTPLPPLLPSGGILLKSGTNFIVIEPTGVRIVGLPTGIQMNTGALMVI